ncbi:MAG: prepilin peptidase [Myxococcota bacterium]|nr:prepilin peptidase [Myxococcota bacterium]
MTPAQSALWVLVGVALVISLVTDLRSQRILDWVTYPALSVALLLRLFWIGPGNLAEGFLSGALGALALVAVFASLAYRGKMGWGDVKLVAVVGAGLGLQLAVAALVFISLMGAAQAVGALLWHRFSPEGPSGGERGERRIPYGVAIALGSFWAMWWDVHSTIS